MNKIKMTIDEFLKKGFDLFGIDKNEWKFVCPVCETIISVNDYVSNGAHDSSIAFSCIGRFLPKSECQRAFGDEKIIKGKPCDYTSAGLINISPIDIEGFSYFNFYEKKE